MSCFVKCMWITGPELNLEERLAEFRNAVTSPEVTAIVGVHWFSPANSMREALNRPFDSSKLGQVKTWRSVLLGGPEYLRLDLWNGGGPPVEAGLYLALPLALSGMNVLSITNIPDREVAADSPLWENAVVATSALASRLGGVCMFGSTRLGRRAAELSVPYPEWTAYLLAWGRDRSGVNADVAWLSGGRNQPGKFEMALVPEARAEDVEIVRFAKALPFRR